MAVCESFAILKQINEKTKKKVVMTKLQKTSFCANVCPWAVRQAKQSSTWRGLAVLASAFGLFASPEQAHLIIGAVASVFGAVDVIKNDSEE